jgi:hypothetical protein
MHVTIALYALVLLLLLLLHSAVFDYCCSMPETAAVQLLSVVYAAVSSAVVPQAALVCALCTHSQLAAADKC